MYSAFASLFQAPPQVPLFVPDPAPVPVSALAPVRAPSHPLPPSIRQGEPDPVHQGEPDLHNQILPVVPDDHAEAHVEPPKKSIFSKLTKANAFYYGKKVAKVAGIVGIVAGVVICGKELYAGHALLTVAGSGLQAVVKGAFYTVGVPAVALWETGKVLVLDAPQLLYHSSVASLNGAASVAQNIGTTLLYSGGATTTAGALSVGSKVAITLAASGVATTASAVSVNGSIAKALVEGGLTTTAGGTSVANQLAQGSQITTSGATVVSATVAKK
ncbi:MAG TPA: hypothetical protein VN457_00430, partial [Chlamydiales bacterium]|nr:hypothetical protein [Chlamydiales bacterium]